MKKKVPSNALKMCGAFELAPKEGIDEEKTSRFMPFRMVARSGDPIDHWFFGQAVHDMEGMKLSGGRIAVDWMHDPQTLVGYANKFEIEDGNLVLGGSITPTSEGDKASEILAQSRAGIPFEASIQFSSRMPGDLKIEELDAGESAEVNGRTINGPATIFREWPLVRVAVCPTGSDANTSTMFTNNEPEETEIEIINREQIDMKNDRQLDAEQSGEAEEHEDREAAELSADAETGDGGGNDAETLSAEAGSEDEHNEDSESQLADGEPVDESQPADRAVFVEFVERFGNDAAARFYAQGMSLEAATVEHNKELKAENERLRAEQGSQSVGASAAEFDASGDSESVSALSAEEERGIEEYARSTGKDAAKLKAARLDAKAKAGK